MPRPARWLVVWLWCGVLAAGIARAETTDLADLFPSAPPDIDVSSFTARAQRYFARADISIDALAAHPDRPDDAITALLRDYRRQLLRGRMELARARALHQTVQPALVDLERFTAAHLETLQHLLPRLSPAAQRVVRHTLYTVTQLHQSAQASLLHPPRPARGSVIGPHRSAATDPSSVMRVRSFPLNAPVTTDTSVLDATPPTAPAVRRTSP